MLLQSTGCPKKNLAFDRTKKNIRRRGEREIEREREREREGGSHRTMVIGTFN